MVSEAEVVCLHRADATVSLTIALIADVHGNLAAFDAVLDALRAEPPDQIVCRGDGAATARGLAPAARAWMSRRGGQRGCGTARCVASGS